MAKTLCKHDHAAKLTIWAPRYHDRRVLLACHKVGNDNIITFSKAPTLEGLFYISGKVVRKFKRESNGSLDVYSVPLAEFQPFNYLERCLHEL